jgi:glycosyltransferase involved in cell wall biosynthesis
MKDKYFLYVGNAYPHKNLDRLIETMIMFNEDGNGRVELKIASSRNIFTQRLQKKINILKVNNFVTLLGSVSDEKLASLYKDSVGFIFPSLSEGFGLPGVEAMRAGTLVLASDIPVFREIYKDNATYFNPFDTHSIEKAMEDVLEMSKEERGERIRKAENFVKCYSWVKMAKETLRIYESCNSVRQGK